MCDVQNLQVTTGAVPDQRGNFKTVTTYSYFIQGHGPFEDVFQDGEDTKEAVLAAREARFQKLIDVGAISANGY